MAIQSGSPFFLNYRNIYCYSIGTRYVALNSHYSSLTLESLTMSEQTNAAPDAPTPARTSPKQPAGVSLLTTCIIAALFSAFSGAASWHFASQNVGGTLVATVDAARLARLKMKTTLDQPGVTNDQATAEAKAFVRQLDKALEAYSNEGILVLNSGAAMNKPAANDITANVAANMGIQLQN
jgi:hypothetical protein